MSSNCSPTWWRRNGASTWANKVDFNVRSAGQDVYFDVQLTDAWVWDVYRSSRFAKSVRIVTFKDVNVEEVQKSDIDIPDGI